MTMAITACRHSATDGVYVRRLGLCATFGLGRSDTSHASNRLAATMDGRIFSLHQRRGVGGGARGSGWNALGTRFALRLFRPLLRAPSRCRDALVFIAAAVDAALCMPWGADALLALRAGATMRATVLRAAVRLASALCSAP